MNANNCNLLIDFDYFFLKFCFLMHKTRKELQKEKQVAGFKVIDKI